MGVAGAPPNRRFGTPLRLRIGGATPGVRSVSTANSWVMKTREMPFRRLVPNWWWTTCLLLAVVAVITIWLAWTPQLAGFGVVPSWVLMYVGPGRWDPR